MKKGASLLVVVILLLSAVCRAEIDTPPIEEGKDLLSVLYGIDRDSIDEMFEYESYLYTEASVPYCSYSFTYRTNRVYRFSIAVSYPDGKLLSYTNPILYKQLQLSEEVGDYAQWFVNNLKHQETIWGDSMWWTYEQKYEFQSANDGYGMEGFVGHFSLPQEGELTHQEALQTAISYYERITGDSYDEKSVRIVESFSAYQTRIYTDPAEQTMKRDPAWLFYFVDQAGQYIYCTVYIRPDGEIEISICNREATVYDIGYMKYIPDIYQKYYNTGDR